MAQYGSQYYPEFGGMSPYAPAYANMPQQGQQAQPQQAQQFATNPEIAARYPEVERVARDRQQIEGTTAMLMHNGLGYDDASAKAYKLFNAQREAGIAAMDEQIASAEEAATYAADYSKFKAKMARINFQNLATAEQEINDTISEFSHLSGAHDPNIAKAFDTSRQYAEKRFQSAYNSIARRLPQGIPVEAVLDEKGRPSVNLINDAIGGRLQQKAEAKGTEAGLVAGAKFPYQEKLIGLRETAKEQGMEKQSGLKIQTAFGMIPAIVKKQEALIPGEVELAGKKQEAITEASMPKPKVSPTPTPLPSSTPEATTEDQPKDLNQINFGM
jgi:hypothetical protein